MTFQDLPLEIHQKVLSYLLSNSDVSALSIQCRALHSICDMATRKKYNSISVTTGEIGIDRAFDFLMDILKQPRLGTYVRHVECRKPTSRLSRGGMGRMDYSEAEPQRDLSDEELKLLRNAIRRGGFEGIHEDRVLNMLLQRMDNSDTIFGGYRARECLGTFITQALTAIIIVSAPNIVTMAMTKPDDDSSRSTIEYPLARIFKQANENPETFYLGHLRSVYLLNISESTWEDGRFYISMDLGGFLKYFRNLPSIESVSSDLIEESESVNYSGEIGSSNVTRIAIHHSALGSTYLARVICSLKVLKELRYSIGGRSSNDGGYHIFNPKAIIKAVCCHQETVEILDIDEGENSGFDHSLTLIDESQFDTHGGPLEFGRSEGNEDIQFLKSIWKNSGTLKDFVSLKSLSLGVSFLLYFAQCGSEDINEGKEKTIADCLPDSLEYLCVRGYVKGENQKADEQMSALTALYQSGSSSLKELVGIEETIPSAEHVNDPDGDSHLLWSLDPDTDTDSDSDSNESETEPENEDNE